MKRGRSLAVAVLAVFLSLNVAPAAVAAPWDGWDSGFSRIIKMLRKSLGMTTSNGESATIPK